MNRDPSIFGAFFAALLSKTSLTIWFTASLITFVTGPFGTIFFLSAVDRAIFWIITCGLAVIFGTAARILSQRFPGKAYPNLSDAVSVLITAALMSPTIWVLTDSVFPVRPDLAPSFWDLARDVALIVIGVFVMRRVIVVPNTSGFDQDGAPVGTDAAPRLVQRLGDSDVRILRLQSQDHHVDVVTTKGVETVRIRLADAVAEMGKEQGDYTHRSHWVAYWAIVGVDGDAAKPALRLINGDTVPVSRTYRSILDSEILADRDSTARRVG